MIVSVGVAVSARQRPTRLTNRTWEPNLAAGDTWAPQVPLVILPGPADPTMT